MRNNRKSVSKLFTAASFELQNLESRTMMSSTLGLSFSGGLLRIAGTIGDDHINVSHVLNSWTISNGNDWTVTKTFNPTSIAAGGSHTCGTRADHALWCWGWNNRGQLGLGDTRIRWTPKRV